MISLITLPPEVIEKIIDNLNHPAYLLSFALTCHQFGNVIIPYHIGCRILRCFASNTAVWHLLSDSPLYAQRVRTLHIGNGQLYDRNAVERYWFKPIAKFGHITPLYMVAPPLYYPKASLETGLSSLASVISYMVQLTRFACTIHEDAPSSYRGVFQALANHASQLLEFELQYAACRGNADEYLIKLFEPVGIHAFVQRRIFTSLQISDFRHLTRVAFVIHDTSRSFGEYVYTLINMVTARCPDLEEFALRVILKRGASVNVTSIFDNTSWHKLRRLTVSGCVMIPDPYTDLLVENCKETMKSFFSKHQNLLALSLDTQNISISQGSMSDGALPNLESVSVRCGTEVPVDPLLSNVIPEDVARNLAYFSTSITTDCLPIIENMKSLRACELVHSSHLLPDFVKVAPDLEKLYVVPSTPWKTEYTDDKVRGCPTYVPNSHMFIEYPAIHERLHPYT